MWDSLGGTLWRLDGVTPPASVCLTAIDHTTGAVLDERTEMNALELLGSTGDYQFHRERGAVRCAPGG